MHGPEQLDDAGVIRIDERRSLVQTIDFFPPIVDEPRDFGRIAAANALSDVYAMGGTPLSALNVVGFPRKTLDMSVLAEILAGGSEKIAESGAALLGGHSVEDGEIKYGLSVTGIVDTDRVWSNDGARVGDVLVLTKPLGMGAVTTSIQQRKEDPAHVREAVASMATLNAGAARAIGDLDVRAVTDITGFGLLGHGSEMARGSDVTLRYDSHALPTTSGARELAAGGCLSGGAGRTRRFLGEHAAIADSLHPAPIDGMRASRFSTHGRMLSWHLRMHALLPLATFAHDSSSSSMLVASAASPCICFAISSVRAAHSASLSS